MSPVSFPTVGESRFAGDKFRDAFFGVDVRDGVARSTQKKGPESDAMRAARKRWSRFTYSTMDAEQLTSDATVSEAEGDG